MNLQKLKKEELLSYVRKVVHENKSLKNQLEGSKELDVDSLKDYALTYKKEIRDGKEVHVAYVLKLNLDDTYKVEEVVEASKELGLYKLEMKIVDYFLINFFDK